MLHNLKSEDGTFKLNVEMYCGHPDIRDNNTESVGCNDNCCVCKHSRAVCTIPEMYELLKRAKCTELR